MHTTLTLLCVDLIHSSLHLVVGLEVGDKGLIDDNTIGTQVLGQSLVNVSGDLALAGICLIEVLGWHLAAHNIVHEGAHLALHIVELEEGLKDHVSVDFVLDCRLHTERDIVLRLGVGVYITLIHPDADGVDRLPQAAVWSAAGFQ